MSGEPVNDYEKLQDDPQPQAPPSVDPRKLHAGVDRVLLSHGEYVPVELLIDQGRLEYSDYEAWRCGKLRTLAEALLGSQRRVTRILTAAAHWARRLGLEPASGEYRSWGAGGTRDLQLAADPKLADLLATHYRRRAREAQRDLFLDSTESVLLHDLLDALAERGAARARAALAALTEIRPDHTASVDAECLVDALAYLDADIPRPPPEIELRRLRDHLRPAAERLLGSRARDFMAPFWRRLADRLEGAEFDPARPEQHASWVRAQCLDWHGVRAAILDSRDFDAEPLLLIRLAEAELRLGERTQAIMRIGLLCWRFAAQGDAALQADAFPDTGVRRAWEVFQDLDLEPPLDAAWFPAVLLLVEPGLARVWDRAPPDEGAPASRAFRALQALVTIPVDAGELATLDQRRALQDSHPGFLRLYVDRLRDRRRAPAAAPR